jgi:alkylation response protein AidB-like acyl-CoA dehydrogenase
MMLPSFRHNFTGAQFVTEVQGGSDVGLNDVMAYQDADRNWRLRGEKWFCSNANADLFLVTGRVGDPDSGTKGLGLFLVPRLWEGNQRNTFSLRRLKEKIGTRTMASAEIDFIDTRCLPVGPVEQGFKMLMEHVLHLSRLYNSFAALGISTRSLQIAMDYAKHRKAFGRPIGHYPLVMEPLGQMLSEVLAVFAGACFAVRLQDQLDQAVQPDASQKMLMRLLANLMKYISGRWAVDHAHHSMDILAGNGTIETFSALPRLLRDSLVIENWEGTHNTLRMQIFRDLCRYDQDQLLLTWLREQLSPHSGPLCEVLKGRIAHLESSCQRFRGLSTMERSLAIKAVVDEMALVYLAVCLFQEAQHQEGQEQCAQKRLALQWFVQQHLSGEEPGLDEGQRLQLLQGLLSVPF